MSEQIKRLSDLARETLEQYTREIGAGGEPAYPDWANDLKAVAAEREQLLAALLAAESFMAGFEGDELQEGIDEKLDAIRAALAAAGAP